MKLVEIDPQQITLTGITLNSSFVLANPHQILALIFELESKPSHFEIEPERGMILRGEKKFIKIRLKPELRHQASRIERQTNWLVVRVTYYCEYNRKLLEKNSLRGWSKVSREFEEHHIPVSLSFQAEVEKLKSSLQREASLKNSRRQNSFEKFRDSSVKRVKDPKLNEDLEFLFRNEEYARQEKMKRPIITAKGQPSSSFSSRGSRKEGRKSVALSPIESDRVKVSRQRGVQIVILAIIAALCLAAGEAFGSVFKR